MINIKDYIYEHPMAFSPRDSQVILFHPVWMFVCVVFVCDDVFRTI